MIEFNCAQPDIIFPILYVFEGKMDTSVRWLSSVCDDINDKRRKADTTKRPTANLQPSTHHHSYPYYCHHRATPPPPPPPPPPPFTRFDVWVVLSVVGVF